MPELLSPRFTQPLNKTRQQPVGRRSQLLNDAEVVAAVVWYVARVNRSQRVRKTCRASREAFVKIRCRRRTYVIVFVRQLKRRTNGSNVLRPNIMASVCSRFFCC